MTRDSDEYEEASGGRPRGFLAPERPSPRRLAEAMRAGPCPDDYAFDRYLPFELRGVSRRYWTPLAVARRAGEWLEQYGATRTLDIGSGAGKFCVATALVSSGEFIGVEHRARLVVAARELATRFEVADRVSFVEGAFGRMETPEADAYYVYNPFGENLYDYRECLDEQVELTHGRYLGDIAATERLLLEAPIGTLLLSYNGFGGRVAGNWVELEVDRALPCVLRLMRKDSVEPVAPPRILDTEDELVFDVDSDSDPVRE